ncbi:hypothetical protein [Sphingomonas sp.]|jgi:hypothetical protein|uniref:hypothetical protein n=1 Tax=Sphingomonas sp. TaxID=28214 RepID=UPI002ED8D53C
MAEYRITVDPAVPLVRIALSGLFAIADVHAFTASLREAHGRFARARGSHLTLCDVSACRIQLQDVVTAFRALLDDKDLMSQRMAFVTGGSPAKMQVRRIINRGSCRFFDDVESAEKWLFSAQANAPHAPHAYASAH